MKLSRRQLAQSLALGTAAAATATLTAQAPPAAATDQGLVSARASLRAATQVVHNVALPMSVEPAFSFKAKG
jgi:hypothetical protein